MVQSVDSMMDDEELKTSREFLQQLQLNPIQEGLKVDVSLISNAGKGLFTTQKFQKGQLVCEYMGIIRTNVQAWRRKDKSYLMKLGNGKYVDAIYSLDVKARYINDCRQRSKYNVYFEKRPQEDRALVIALRDIEEGEELYVDYGKFYWVAYNLLHPDQPVR